MPAWKSKPAFSETLSVLGVGGGVELLTSRVSQTPVILNPSREKSLNSFSYRRTSQRRWAFRMQFQ